MERKHFYRYHRVVYVGIYHANQKTFMRRKVDIPFLSLFSHPARLPDNKEINTKTSYSHCPSFFSSLHAMRCDSDGHPKLVVPNVKKTRYIYKRRRLHPESDFHPDLYINHAQTYQR